MAKNVQEGELAIDGHAPRLVDKSDSAFRTISEVSDVLGVPQHVLRFWEGKFSQIRPLKRGGGRRYYRPGDVDVLFLVKEYLYERGYTIRGVQKLLKGGLTDLARGDGSPGKGTEEDLQDQSDEEMELTHPSDGSSAKGYVPAMFVNSSHGSAVPPTIEVSPFFDFSSEALARPDLDSLRIVREELVSLRDYLQGSLR